VVSKNRLEDLPNIRRNVILADYSWFRIGGPVDFFININDIDNAEALLRLCREEGVPCFILGGGSNVLFPDAGFRGLVIRIGMHKLDLQSEKLTAEAGVALKSLMEEAAGRGYGGWEGLYGIPGTIGGAVRGNAGAYGVEIADFVHTVRYIDNQLERKEIINDGSLFSYRNSVFKNSGVLIYEIEFSLKQVDKDKSIKKMRRIGEERKKKHPTKMTAGCFYKNPEGSGHTAAELIEAVGMKGKKVGNAVVSEKHANFIVNTGGAFSSDILELASEIKDRVMRKYGIVLLEEVEVVGDSS